MTRVPLPPPGATRKTTGCEYCSVGCGYVVYTWPVGEEGGPEAANNALNRAFPMRRPGGGWPAPLMHNVVQVDGAPHNVLVLPDPDSKVVNLRGNHSVRGAGLAKRLYRSEGPTSDRFTRPLLRVGGQLQPISWDAATDIVAQVSRHVVDTHGPLAWGMKRASYGGHENSYAITKLAWRAIGSANHAPHHAPSDGDDAPGLSDAGIDAFSACYEDDREADVLFIAGTEPYETKSVRFLDWMVAGGAKIIHVDPRKTLTSRYAEDRGGMHLQVQIGTDVALLGALARLIIKRGWYDADFVNTYISSDAEVAEDRHWRRRRFGTGFDSYGQWLRNEDAFSLESASAISGVAIADIERAAELLTGGDSGVRPKVAIYFEKGIMWSHNHEGTAALANLALLLGSVGRPGRAVSRLGGHQRGGQTAGGYPMSQSPHHFEGNAVHMDADRWFVEGKTRFMWGIALNWVGCSAASAVIADTLERLVRNTGPQVQSADVESVVATLKQRVDAGGTVLVMQELYPNDTTAYADLILPAAGWGERTFTRHNAERRLRLYEQFMDPPGEARSDWRIVAEVAQKMGYDGFDWPNANAVFDEAAETSRSGRLDFSTLVIAAQIRGQSSYELLRGYGTTGIQTPVDLAEGELVGTVRMHADLRFKTSNRKANFVRAAWSTVETRYHALAPRGGELWVTNMRVNELWNNLSDSIRRADVVQRWPANCLQLNTADAAQLGITSGDQVRVENNTVLDQLGRETIGSFEAVAYVTDEVPAGLACSYLMYPGSLSNAIVPADTTLQAVNLRYNFKLGRGRIVRVGRSEFADSMPLAPRNLI